MAYPPPVQTVSVEDRTVAHASYRVDGDEDRPFLAQPYTGGFANADPTGWHWPNAPWPRDGIGGPPAAS